MLSISYLVASVLVFLHACFFLRFLCAHRSRRSDSLKSSPADPRDGAAASQPPSALTSRPPSTHGAPEPIVDAATGTSHSPARPQYSAAHLSMDRVQGDTRGKLPQVAPRITPINFLDANFELYPHGSVPRPPIRHPRIPNTADAAQALHSSGPPTMPSPQCSVPERHGRPDKDPPPPSHQDQGLFYQAHDFSATGNFIDGNVGSVTNYFSGSDDFMKDFLKETIPGAAADSSARDPPPRCHPGTRLALLERCLSFIVTCSGVKKMRWIVGGAGVGKSAVMQSVTESPQLEVVSNASVFLSINGRSDGTKAILTLSYQFAAKSDMYRWVIMNEVGRDPSLLQSSMSVQFEKLVIQPFIHSLSINTAGRVLAIIDGLDECDDTHTQIELLRLISNFCVSYPSSPIVWLIASRPEPHITSFFSRPEVAPAFEKEEIAVDSDTARIDVEQFLRHELSEIGKASGFLGSQWPDEPLLWKLAKAAGGLFAYAHTAIRYIGDSNFGDPVSQLSDVLDVIDELPMSDIPPEQHPMALLDALYGRILSRVPHKIMINIRKLLLVLVSDRTVLRSSDFMNFIIMCNWLGMTADEAYAALNRLRSVFNFPQRHEANQTVPKPFHKSFVDSLFRSRFFPNFNQEAQQIKAQCAIRVLEEVPSGIDFGDVDYMTYYGKLARNAATGNKISITWRAGEETDWRDDQTRWYMYRLAIEEVVAGIERGDPVFQDEYCIKPITTGFLWYNNDHFPHQQLRDYVFGGARSHEFVNSSVLKQIPVKVVATFSISTIVNIKLQFHRPVTATDIPDRWNSPCDHERVGQWEQGKEQNWTTVFDWNKCTFCFRRLTRHLETWITQHPNHDVSVIGSAGMCCAEFRFVDPEDDVSEWACWVWLWNSSGSRELERTV